MVLVIVWLLIILSGLAVAVGQTAAQSHSRSPPLFQPWAVPDRSGGLPDIYGSSARSPRFPADVARRPAGAGFLEETFNGAVRGLPSRLRRQHVDYAAKEPVGTIIVDTANTYLYLVLGSGRALRYGIGVGREGFTWAGRERISRMAEWPDWRPPAEMIERDPGLPRFVPGGLTNPLGARALYLGNTLYRIHGTNDVSTIGTYASSGCIRLRNEDIIDLYQRVTVGTEVVVLSEISGPSASAPW